MFHFKNYNNYLKNNYRILQYLKKYYCQTIHITSIIIFTQKFSPCYINHNFLSYIPRFISHKYSYLFFHLFFFLLYYSLSRNLNLFQLIFHANIHYKDNDTRVIFVARMLAAWKKYLYIYRYKYIPVYIL